MSPSAIRVVLSVVHTEQGKPVLSMESNADPHTTISLLADALRATASQLEAKPLPRVLAVSGLPKLESN